MGWKLGDACNFPPRIASRPPRETLPQCSDPELLIMHKCTRAGRNTSTTIQWLIQVHTDQHSDKCGKANSLPTPHLEGTAEASESKSCVIINPFVSQRSHWAASCSSVRNAWLHGLPFREEPFAPGRRRGTLGTQAHTHCPFDSTDSSTLCLVCLNTVALPDYLKDTTDLRNSWYSK